MSTESTKVLTSRHGIVASGVGFPAVCRYPCWCRVGDLIMRPGLPVQEWYSRLSFDQRLERPWKLETQVQIGETDEEGDMSLNLDFKACVA